MDVAEDEIAHWATVLSPEPLDDLIDELFDRASPGVESEVGLAVRHEPLIIESFHLDPIGRERPAAVERHALEKHRRTAHRAR